MTPSPVITTNRTLTQLFNQGYAPNSPEAQAAARAQLQQQIQQAQLQKQEANRRAAELAEALDTAAAGGEAKDLSWMKPSAPQPQPKPVTTPQPTVQPLTAPQITNIPTIQPNANIQIQPSQSLQKLNKSLQQQNKLTYFKPTGEIRTAGDDKPISFSDRQLKEAEYLTKQSNPIGQLVGNMYLGANDPNAPLSAARYERFAAERSGVDVAAGEKFNTGDPFNDFMMNVGGTIALIPSNLERLGAAAAFGAYKFASGLSSGNLTVEQAGKALKGGAIDTGNALIENVTDPVTLTANLITLPLAFTKVPKIKVPTVKVKTTKTPTVTVKDKTITFGKPGEKQTTIERTKTIKTDLNTGNQIGKIKQTIVTTDKGKSAGIQRGTIKTNDSVTKSGTIEINTGKQQLTINRTVGTKTAVKNDTVNIMGPKGERITQTKAGKATDKIKGVMVKSTKIKNGDATTKTTTRTRRAAGENIRISETINGKTRTGRQYNRVTKQEYNVELDGDILKSRKRQQERQTNKVDTAQNLPDNLLTGQVRKTPKIEFKKEGGVTILSTGGGPSVTKGIKVTTGQKTIQGTKTTVTGKQTKTTRSSATFTNPKTGTAKGVKTTTEVTAKTKAKPERTSKTDRKTVKTNRRENSARAAEEAYKQRVEQMQLRRLIKQYGRKKGMEEAIKRGYIISSSRTKSTTTKPVTTPKQTKPQTPTGTVGGGSSSRTTGGSGGGLLMMEKPLQQKQKPRTQQTKQQQQKQTAKPAAVIITGTAKPAGQVKLTGAVSKQATEKVKVKPAVSTKQQGRQTAQQQQVRPEIRGPKTTLRQQQKIKTAATTIVLKAATPAAPPREKQEEEQKKKVILAVAPATIPMVKRAAATTQTQTPKQTRKVKPVVATRQKTKKRLKIPEEEWNKPKKKKKPKKGKAALRLETVNQFGWLGFDAKPAAKPKLIVLK